MAQQQQQDEEPHAASVATGTCDRCSGSPMELAGFGVPAVLVEPGFVKSDIANASATDAAAHGPGWSTTP